MGSELSGGLLPGGLLPGGPLAGGSSDGSTLMIEICGGPIGAQRSRQIMPAGKEKARWHSEVKEEPGDKSGNPKMRNAKPFVQSLGTTVETVLPEVVVVTKAPAVVQVEVVIVWMVTPLGRACTVVVMLSG